MASGRKHVLPRLEERFIFPPSAAAPGDRDALRSMVYEVEERTTGEERTLKLWRKTGGNLDKDLRELWRHEMRQISRLMAYSGARDVIVDLLEFVEDDESFGVVLARVGQPLDQKRRRVPPQHWLKTLGAARGRSLFWRNIRRVVQALGIVHAQGLVHGAVDLHAIMTNGDDQPDFQLGGFEWSVVLTGGEAGVVQAEVGVAAAARRPASYAFAEDWRRLAVAIAEYLGFSVGADGRLIARGDRDRAILLTSGEQRLLRQLLTPSRYDQINAESTLSAIDSLLRQLTTAGAVRAGTLVMSITQSAGLGRRIYAATKGAVAIDETARQQEWVRSDLLGGATVLAPRGFDPETSRLRLVTENMVYDLAPSRPDGAAKWDHAACTRLTQRDDNFRVGDDQEHEVVQPILVARNESDAEKRIAALGPDALDWSAFGGVAAQETHDEAERVRRAMLVIQVIEAVVKALEAFPVQILAQQRENGQPTVVLRALPDNDRDRVAKKLGVSTTYQTLQRLFAEAGADAEMKWRLSKAQSLGASRQSDVNVSFVEVADHKGARAYRFEADELLPDKGV